MLKSKIRRLFKAIGGKRKASPIPSKVITVHQIDIPMDDPQKIKQMVIDGDYSFAGNNPQMQEVIQQIANAIPSVKNSKPIDVNQIQIDTSALLVMLMTSGYEPLQVLMLMTKLYGSIMASAPTEIGEKEDGTKITPEMVEADFFKACADQRKHFQKINDQLFGGVEEVLGKGTIH